MYIHSIGAVCFCCSELPGAETSCYPQRACSLACGESQLLLKSTDVLKLIETLVVGKMGGSDLRVEIQLSDPSAV